MFAFSSRSIGWSGRSAALALFLVWFSSGLVEAQTVSSAYSISTFAGRTNRGTADGTGTAAQFNDIGGVSIDTAGNFIVADAGSNTRRKVTPAGVVTTIYGSAGAPAVSVDGSGGTARFAYPVATVVDLAGNIHVSDLLTASIRKITSGGVVTTVAGPGGAVVPNLSNFGYADRTGSVGAFALTPGSKDAALTISLPPGGYTVQVSGADGGTGEALVELYELP